jgi:WD40 repeat protein
MKPRVVAGVLAGLLAPLAFAQPRLDAPPVLRLDGGGPTSYVASLAFAPDGQTLYAAGFDKLVRAWEARNDGWHLSPAAYRVPIGPGLAGALNTVAVSPDGQYLAAAGLGVFRDLSGFRDKGQIVPGAALRPEQWLDQGTLFVWHRPTGKLTTLRGHAGDVQAVSFAPGSPARLVSAGRDYDANSEKFVGRLRVWDVASAQEVAQLTLPGFSVRPALSVQRIGAAPNALRVFLAASDAKFRRWDVASKRVELEAFDSNFNHGVAEVPTGVVTTSTRTDDQKNNFGQLRLWTTADTKAPASQHDFGVGQLPRAVAAVSSTGTGTADYLACVTEAQGDFDFSYRLVLVNLKTWRESVSVDLWRGPRRQPALASCLLGKHLAVAGNDAHTIQLFDISTLLNGPAQPIVLRGVGVRWQAVSFVRNGNGLGLLLHDKPKDEPGSAARPVDPRSQVFDLGLRKLLAVPVGWTHAEPAPGPWTAKHVAAEGADPQRPTQWAISLRQGGQEVRRILLGKGAAFEEIDDYALLPASDVSPVPVLAVASRQQGQPRLALFNVLTGERFRVLTGHTEPLRSVAFSPDGRLLVTTSVDQTVCVWSLTNLPKVLGKYGLVRGLAVRPIEGGLAIGPSVPADLHPDNAAALQASTIVPGDRIIGLTIGEQTLTPTTSKEFYEAIYRLPPGQFVSVAVANKPAAQLRVGQAIDERKPLFTLFVSRPANGVATEWIAWSPNGPYEYSARLAERWIGWHFNTGTPDQPGATTAAADQYHDEFYRDGIIARLIERAELAAAVRDWDDAEAAKRVPAPVFKTFLGDTELTPGAVTVLPAVPTRLDVQIGNTPAHYLGATSWEVLTVAPAAAFAPRVAGDPTARTADVRAVAWPKGVVTLRVRVATNTPTPVVVVEEYPVRIELPAQVARVPNLEVRPDAVTFRWKTPALGNLLYRTTNDELDVSWQTVVQPNTPAFQTELVVNGKVRPQFTTTDHGGAATIPLQPGMNRLELRVRESWGTEMTAGVSFVYVAPPTLTPNAAPAEVTTPLVELSATVESVSPVVAQSARVTVNGRVVPVVPTLAANRLALTGVPLDVGANRVAVTVANADGPALKAAEWAIKLAPPQPPQPPEVTFVEPADGARTTNERVRVQLRVASGKPLTRVELIRSANGNHERIAVEKPDAAFEVPLVPGVNTLRAVAVNADGSREASVLVSRLHRPVELVLEGVLPRDGADLLKATVNANGTLVYPPIPTARAQLWGKIVWRPENAAEVRQNPSVRVFVNGFQQALAKLEVPADEQTLSAQFTADVWLNAAHNRVEIELPGLKQRNEDRQALHLACTQPAPVRQYQLLSVLAGGTSADEAALTKAVMYGLPAGKVTVQKPLTGDISRQQLLGQLLKLKQVQSRTAAAGSANDVVLLHLAGSEVLRPDGHYLRTSANEDTNYASTALRVETLTEILGAMPGAQIAVLQVDRPANSDLAYDRLARNLSDPHVGVLRCATEQPGAARFELWSRLTARSGLLHEAVTRLTGSEFVWKSERGQWVRRGQDGTTLDVLVPAGVGQVSVGR